MNYTIQQLVRGKANRFIIRTNESDKICTFMNPIKIASSAVTESGPKSITSNQYKHIRSYQLQEDIYDSEYIIKNYSHEISNQYFQVTQEYYDQTLHSVNLKQLTYAQKIRIITKLGQIVKFTIQNNLCIRSLRPQTIAIRRIGGQIKVKLAWMDDFVVFIQDKRQTSQPLLQNTQFSAPQILAKKSHGVEADVWSLGAIFYWLLFSALDYRIEFINGQQIIKYPKNVPTWLTKILNHMLHQYPKQRCSIAVALSYFKSLNCCIETSQKIMQSVFQN